MHNMVLKIFHNGMYHNFSVINDGELYSCRHKKRTLRIGVRDMFQLRNLLGFAIGVDVRRLYDSSFEPHVKLAGIAVDLLVSLLLVSALEKTKQVEEDREVI